MAKILDFEAAKERRVIAVVNSAIADNLRAAGNCGLEQTVNLTMFVPQGVRPASAFEDSPYVPNLNRYQFRVNNDLVRDGWQIAGAVRVDEDYFAKRAKFLSGVKWKNVREERSNYLGSGYPVMVFYGKH